MQGTKIVQCQKLRCKKLKSNDDDDDDKKRHLFSKYLPHIVKYFSSETYSYPINYTIPWMNVHTLVIAERLFQKSQHDGVLGHKISEMLSC